MDDDKALWRERMQAVVYWQDDGFTDFPCFGPTGWKCTDCPSNICLGIEGAKDGARAYLADPKNKEE